MNETKQVFEQVYESYRGEGASIFSQVA